MWSISGPWEHTTESMKWPEPSLLTTLLEMALVTMFQLMNTSDFTHFANANDEVFKGMYCCQ